MKFQKEFEETADGEIVEKWIYDGKELATEEFALSLHMAARAYTDSFDIKSKIALGFSIVGAGISIFSIVLRMFF